MTVLYYTLLKMNIPLACSYHIGPYDFRAQGQHGFRALSWRLPLNSGTQSLRACKAWVESSKPTEAETTPLADVPIFSSKRQPKS